MSTLDLASGLAIDEDEDSEEDEDYVPSEEESDEELSGGEDHDAAAGSDTEAQPAKKGKKRKQKGSALKARKRRGGIWEEGGKTEKAEEAEESLKKEHQELDEKEDKKKSDDLWASFLQDVQPSTSEKKVSLSSSSNSSRSATLSNASETKSKRLVELPEDSPAPSEKPSKVTITQEFDFAGETVKVTKEVDLNSDEALNFQKQESSGKVPPVTNGDGGPSPTKPQTSSAKKPGGLGSVLGQILNKKQKISTLDKSKLDWLQYKKDLGIEEELTKHVKGKDGYLEKQAFLQRADLRQFEIEKGIREKNRVKRLV